MYPVNEPVALDPEITIEEVPVVAASVRNVMAVVPLAMGRTGGHVPDVNVEFPP